jgi:hypothetical protein
MNAGGDGRDEQTESWMVGNDISDDERMRKFEAMKAKKLMQLEVTMMEYLAVSRNNIPYI